MVRTIILHPQSQTLVDRLTGTLPHALVIDGPTGVGVRVIAEQLASSMGSPLLVVEPKKSLNGQFVVDPNEGNIIIEDIRLLYRQTRARQSTNQVYILDTGERGITIAAQNAFLKLLEEPRSGLYFIIATHHYDQLLPTITSRSQRLTLLPVTNKQTMEVIDELAITDEVMRARLAFVGNGRPGIIKRLAADAKTYESRITIMADAKTMIAGKPDERLAIVHKYKDSRANAVTLLDDMNHQIKVIIKNNPDPALVSRISRHLVGRERILAGGNIRLQLLNCVL